MMAVSAPIVSAPAIPLTEYTPWSWRTSLFSVALMIIVSWLVWLPQIRKGPRRHNRTANQQRTPLWRSSIAWQVTFFLGCNSLFYYIFVSWLPSLLTSLGFGATAAANMHGLMQLASAVAGLLIFPVVWDFSYPSTACVFWCLPFFIC